MSEHLPDQSGIARDGLITENLVQHQVAIGSLGIFNRLRNKWTTIAAVASAVVAIATAPSFEEQPAYAANTETAVVGMPFDGKWAAASLVNPDAQGNYSDATSSHPSVHPRTGTSEPDWTTDLYAAPGTEANFNIGSVSGNTVEYKISNVAETSCAAGKRVRVNIKVDNVNIGWVQYEHLETNITNDTLISPGYLLGKTKNWGNLTCYKVSNDAGTHLHVAMKNVEDKHSCYVNHGKPGEKALSAGVGLGVLGSTNGDIQQACVEAPSDPDTDSDGAKDSKDDCPTISGNQYAPYYGCPTHDPTPSNVPLTAESPYGTALSSWGSHRLDAFRVNASGRMEHRYFSGSGWTDWVLLEPNAAQDVTIVGKPAATSWGWGRIDVFGIGTDGKIKQKLIDSNSGWSPWVDLPALPNSPDCLKNGLAATHWGQGNLDVFGIGCSSNSMKHLWLRNNQWQGWEDKGGCIQNAPAAVAWGPGRIDTFVRGCDNNLYTNVVADGAWSGWAGLGGCLSSGPAVASQKANSLDVFARGCEGAGNSLLHMAYRPNAWSPWQNWGGNIAQAPSAVSWWPNRLDVISTGPDNQSTHFHFDRGVPGSGWNSL